MMLIHVLLSGLLAMAFNRLLYPDSGVSAYVGSAVIAVVLRVGMFRVVGL